MKKQNVLYFLGLQKTCKTKTRNLEAKAKSDNGQKTLGDQRLSAELGRRIFAALWAEGELTLMTWEHCLENTGKDSYAKWAKDSSQKRKHKTF